MFYDGGGAWPWQEDGLGPMVHPLQHTQTSPVQEAGARQAVPDSQREFKGVLILPPSPPHPPNGFVCERETPHVRMALGSVSPMVFVQAPLSSLSFVPVD